MLKFFRSFKDKNSRLKGSKISKRRTAGGILVVRVYYFIIFLQLLTTFLYRGVGLEENTIEDIHSNISLVLIAIPLIQNSLIYLNYIIILKMPGFCRDKVMIFVSWYFITVNFILLILTVLLTVLPTDFIVKLMEIWESDLVLA